jgi:hypothetical protein
MLVILALGKLRQEDNKFKVFLGYRAKPYLKNKRKELNRLDLKSHVAHHCKTALGR